MRNFYNDGTGDYAIQNEFTAYLQTAIRRVKVRYLRKRQRVMAAEIPNSALFKDGILNCFEDAVFFYLLRDLDNKDENIDERIHITEILKQLTDRERIILRLKIIDGYTFPEIATAMAQEINTVKTVYYRTLKKLRAQLET